MKSTYESMDQLNQAIEQFINKKPHIKPILDAFAPILHLKYQMMDKNLFPEIQHQQRTTNTLNGNLPLLQQLVPCLPHEVFQELARHVMAAIEQGFPLTRKGLNVLADEIMAGRIKPSDLFTQPSDFVEDQAKNKGVDGPLLNLFMAVLRKLVLNKWRAVIAPQCSISQWEKGSCPVCGSLPILSVSFSKGRPWLYCGTCGHEWQFPWAKCPACDHESPEEAQYFFVEDEKDEKAFVCRNCNRYILSARVYEDAEAVDLDLLSIGLTHLDVIMQEKGMLPMQFCMWNNFLTG